MPLPNTVSSPDDLAAAAASIVRLRQAMDWMITHPGWEGVVARSIAQLGLKGKRQGVGFRQAALSLPIESKTETIRLAFHLGLEAPRVAEAKRLVALWGETSRGLDTARAHVGAKQWTELCSRLLLRLSARYEEYKRAQASLFREYAPLVGTVANALSRDAVAREDAKQEGSIALLEAIDRIDPEKEFIPYARHWIRRKAVNCLMRQRAIVSVPINLISTSLRADDAEAHSPKVAAAQAALRSGRADPVGIEFERVACPAVGPDQSAIQSDDFAQLRLAMDGLTEKQRQVLELRFGFNDSFSGQSLAEVAVQAGISRQQVHQREQRALSSLARILGADSSRETAMSAETLD